MPLAACEPNPCVRVRGSAPFGGHCPLCGVVSAAADCLPGVRGAGGGCGSLEHPPMRVRDLKLGT